MRNLHENETGIVSLIIEIADLLSNAAVSPNHTPNVYATFLRRLITAGTGHPTAPPSRCASPTSTKISGSKDVTISKVDHDEEGGQSKDAADESLTSHTLHTAIDNNAALEANHVLPGWGGGLGGVSADDQTGLESLFAQGFFDSALLPGQYSCRNWSISSLIRFANRFSSHDESNAYPIPWFSNHPRHCQYATLLSE